VPTFSASAQALSSAALRAASLSATMRWLASDTCVPESKFCRYAVYVGDGAGFLGIGPGLLVGLLARLLIGRLLLRRGLLRIRGLAASRREGSPSNGCNNREFRK
jgi:hypothetical protein